MSERWQATIDGNTWFDVSSVRRQRYAVPADMTITISAELVPGAGPEGMGEHEEGDEGIPFVVAIPNSIPGAEPHFHHTGLAGMMWNGWFILGFGDEVVADEIARLVSHAIRREAS